MRTAAGGFAAELVLFNKLGCVKSDLILLIVAMYCLFVLFVAPAAVPFRTFALPFNSANSVKDWTLSATDTFF